MTTPPTTHLALDVEILPKFPLLGLDVELSELLLHARLNLSKSSLILLDLDLLELLPVWLKVSTC